MPPTLFPTNLNTSRTALFVCTTVLMLLSPSPALAGMPQNPFQLNEIAKLRIESISFFVVVVLLLALLVRWIWNGLAKDWPLLPRLSYLRSLGLIFIWGLAMAVVLSMITGARELMTPGAWEKVGATYRVADDGAVSPETQLLDARRAKLESLGNALIRYADKHGQFPYYSDIRNIEPELWNTLNREHRYIFCYVEDPKANPPALLAYEPSIYGDKRFGLYADGCVKHLTLQELRNDIFQMRMNAYSRREAKRIAEEEDRKNRELRPAPQSEGQNQ